MLASPLPQLPADLGISSDELLRTVLDISQTGIILLRPVYDEADAATITDFTWAYLNPTAQQQLNLPAQPIESLLTRFPIVATSGMFAFYCAAFASGQVERQHQPYQHISPPRSFHLVARRQGDLLLVNFTDSNAWSRPALAEALREARAQRAQLTTQKRLLNQILGQLPAAIAVYHGPEHQLSFFNAQFQTLVNQRAELGKPVATLFPEAVSQGFITLLDSVYTTGQTSEQADMPVELRDPSTGQPQQLYMDNAYQPLRNVQGQPHGVLAFMVNTTDKVLARAAADASARQLHLLTTALPALIAYVDSNQRYQFVNQAYNGWFEKYPDTIIGTTIRSLVGDVAYAVTVGYIERALAGERLTFDARMPYRPNFIRHIHTSFIPDVQQGMVKGFYSLTSDVTDQVLAREQLQDLNEELAVMNEELQATNEELSDTNLRLLRTNKDLDNFVYTASHDLKAPISNLEALLTALREELPPAALATTDVATLLDMMGGATTRFRQTLSHLTSIAKLQSPDVLPTEAVDLPRLVQDVCLDLRPLLESTGATLRLDLDLVPTVQFAPQHLRSIIYNLLSNALKYHAPNRPPVVRLHAHRTLGRVKLTVQDNGLGLDKAQQGKLFGLFRRLHDHVEGSGVGLYVVKRIVENAGGTIAVQSQPDRGSIFTVVLPG